MFVYVLVETGSGAAIRMIARFLTLREDDSDEN